MGQGALFQDALLQVPYASTILAPSSQDRGRVRYLQQEQITRVDWPACSPDLNPIEHAWDQLGRAVQTRLNVECTRVGGVG